MIVVVAVIEGLVERVVAEVIVGMVQGVVQRLVDKFGAGLVVWTDHGSGYGGLWVVDGEAGLCGHEVGVGAQIPFRISI